MEFSRRKFIVSRRIPKKIVDFHVCLSWPTVVYVQEQSVWTPTLYCLWMRILFRVSKVSWLVQIHGIDLSAAEPKMHNRGSAVNHFLSAKRQFFVFFLLFSLQIVIFARWLTVNGTCRVVKSSFVPKYLKTSFCQVYVQFDRATHANQSKIISAFFSPFLYLLCLRDVADAGSD